MQATCFNCGGPVIWDNDFDPEDMGFEEKGIMHICHCNDCKAEIHYIVREEEDE
jgi:hypothetical protein